MRIRHDVVITNKVKSSNIKIQALLDDLIEYMYSDPELYVKAHTLLSNNLSGIINVYPYNFHDIINRLSNKEIYCEFKDLMKHLNEKSNILINVYDKFPNTYTGYIEILDIYDDFIKIRISSIQAISNNSNNKDTDYYIELRLCDDFIDRLNNDEKYDDLHEYNKILEAFNNEINSSDQNYLNNICKYMIKDYNCNKSKIEIEKYYFYFDSDKISKMYKKDIINIKLNILITTKNNSITTIRKCVIGKFTDYIEIVMLD